jgi:hypothetical protein
MASVLGLAQRTISLERSLCARQPMVPALQDIMKILQRGQGKDRTFVEN